MRLSPLALVFLTACNPANPASPPAAPSTAEPPARGRPWEAPADRAPLPSTAEPPAPPPSASAAPAAARPPEDSTFTPLPGFAGAFVVRGLPPVTRVSVSTWPGFACALDRAGTVWCWGDPAVGSMDASGLAFARPTPVDAVSPAIDLAAGRTQICVLGDTLRCAGRGMEPEPPVIRGARALDAGSDHACALTREGRVSCWGSASLGQLGGDSSPTLVPGVSGATAVAAGPFGSCAVRPPGTLMCWGAASLIPWAPGGVGYVAPRPTPPTALLGMSDVEHVSLRGPSPCLLRRGGRVHCWSPEDAATLLPQNPLPASSEVRGVKGPIAALSGTLLVRPQGELLAIDIVFDAQFASSFEARPLGVGAIGPVAQADGSRARGCVATREGRVVCWGTPRVP